MKIFNNKEVDIWKNRVETFTSNRIIELPIDDIKNIVNDLPFEITEKNMVICDNIVREQIRTLLYTLNVMLQAFEYLEKAGKLKYHNEEIARKECLGLLYNQSTWKESYYLVGEDLGCTPERYESRFPRVNDNFESQFYEKGIISAYLLLIDDLHNGIVIDRKTMFDALRCIFERNKALLRFKLERYLIQRKIREI